MTLPDRKLCAYPQAHQVGGVGYQRDFIEIIYSPGQPDLTITPRPEILDVKIADAQ